MSGRVLIVDDLKPNVKLLEAKLASEYFDVLTAFNGSEAIKKTIEHAPDIILLDVMMPGMDGYEVCRHLKSDLKTAHIPIIMVTALSEISDRVHGLEVGADDFLTKPVNDTALIARVRSLLRLKMTMDEWHRREETCDQFGVINSTHSFLDIDTKNPHVLIVDKRESIVQKIKEILASDEDRIVTASTQEDAVKLSKKNDFDLVIVGNVPELEGGDSLRLCSILRSREETRKVPILLLVEEDDTDRLAKGLEIGVNDYLVKPIDSSELLARIRTQIRRKRYQDLLQENYERSLSLALTDSLTGLYNRRYAHAHISTTIQRSHEDGRPIALLMVDIDFFKNINDTYGHGVGDEVLCQLSERIVHCVRSFDMVARMGGEEFVIVLPDAQPAVVMSVAERLRITVAERPFKVSHEVGEINITISIGAAMMDPGKDTPESLLKKADDVLYEAKRKGRNQVVPDFPFDFEKALPLEAAIE